MSSRRRRRLIDRPQARAVAQQALAMCNAPGGLPAKGLLADVTDLLGRALDDLDAADPLTDPAQPDAAGDHDG